MILITGASGFLGKSILNFFSSQDISILSVGRNSLNEIKCDLSSEIPNLNLTEIELVIHAAGKAHSIPINQLEINRFFEVNVIGTQNLLKGLALAGVPKHFVFISSVAVYGLNEGNKINENSPLLAIDPYGLSKIQAERVVIDWCNKNKVVCTILRLPLLIGKNPPGNLGSMIKAIQKGYYFNVGGGKAKKSMVLAEDVARFIPVIPPIGGIYNLTDGVHPSFYQISSAIAKNRIANLPLPIVKIIAKVGDLLGTKAPLNSLKVKKMTSDLTFDDSKAREMGWKPQPVLEYLKHNDL